MEEAEISKGIISALEEEINVMSDVPSNDTAGCEEEVNSRRLKGASKELNERLDIAKIARLPCSVSKKMLTHWKPRVKSITGVQDTFDDFSDPTRLNRNIADPYVEPKGVEQLINQWIADEKISQSQGQMLK